MSNSLCSVSARYTTVEPVVGVAAYSRNGAWGYRNEAHTGGLQKVGGIGEQLTNRLLAEAQPA